MPVVTQRVEMSLRELDMRRNLGKEAQVGSFNLGSYAMDQMRLHEQGFR